MSQHRIISILSLESLVYWSLELSISFINCAQEGASLMISKWRAVKEKMRQHQGHTNKMDSEYLENYVWIYADASDLDQGVVLWGIWFLCNCDNLNTLFRDGLINFNKFFLKTLGVVVLRRLGSNLFHSITLDGKKDFLKKLYLVWRRVILSVFLVL